jgi:hypothetical protein
MKYAIYQDPLTHRFALLRIPNNFKDGDAPPTVPGDRWFDTREEAVATLPALFAREDWDLRRE